MMKVVGLTGPTGAGKSLFARAAAARGWATIDCDRSVRRVYAEDRVLVDRLVEAFGPGVRAADGSVDRTALADAAFAGPAATERLNEIVLPRVCLQIERELNTLRENRTRFTLLDAPTLYESGLDARCDCVVAVLADLERRRGRIIERDAISGARAERRLSAGKPDDFYRARANYILANNGTTSDFLRDAEALLNQMEKGVD